MNKNNIIKIIEIRASKNYLTDEKSPRLVFCHAICLNNNNVARVPFNRGRITVDSFIVYR